METLRQGVLALYQGGVLPDMFQYAFLTNALVAALVMGPLLGALGPLVVVKRLAFFSEAVGHGALTGVALGILLGEPATQPLVALFSFCLMFALLLHWVKSRTQVPYDALVGVFLSFAIALGAALLLYVAKKVNVHILENVLFGSILTVKDTDILVLAVIAALALWLIWRGANRALLASLSPELAQTRGINVRLYDYLFVLLIALVTVASVKVVGAILVGALLLIPATTARLISRNGRQFFWLSVLFSTLSCLLGIVVPMAGALPIPSGAAIVLFAAVGFVLALVLRRWRNIE
ncbi:metal ABC transporter permease [Oceanimonas sp. NS1]|uniref:Zinc ABC transporter permease n=1 Tax=Oceanimonas doudoroffii TaxID=84158 RepID=A0A233RC38_9GAMM|nr:MULTISPECIES: metal ABC transporter permease [Oceanimonas]MCT7654202.1 metal ABC transporter permease [Oceanimonas sp. NS1]NHI01043.1 High-affinity zinc uptake system membrane protein ZnuB [Oceanimonas sp. MB9]OXY80956.1 zinc ABC transporter permease [Oceanimonas doudoroffii]